MSLIRRGRASGRWAGAQGRADVSLGLTCHPGRVLGWTGPCVPASSLPLPSFDRSGPGLGRWTPIPQPVLLHLPVGRLGRAPGVGSLRVSGPWLPSSRPCTLHLPLLVLGSQCGVHLGARGPRTRSEVRGRRCPHSDALVGILVSGLSPKDPPDSGLLPVPCLRSRAAPSGPQTVGTWAESPPEPRAS